MTGKREREKERGEGWIQKKEGQNGPTAICQFLVRSTSLRMDETLKCNASYAHGSINTRQPTYYGPFETQRPFHLRNKSFVGPLGFT